MDLCTCRPKWLTFSSLNNWGILASIFQIFGKMKGAIFAIAFECITKVWGCFGVSVFAIHEP
jgi:hypothetical protein